MSITNLAEGIYKISANIEEILFEEVWEIPNGVSLNSYIVKGEKTAIIDGVCGWDGVPETLFELLDQMDISVESIDYFVINHMEPDHTGWIEQLKKIKPDMQVVISFAGEKLLEAFFGKLDNVHIVKNGDIIDLGGRALKFISTPNVHWPDTMITIDSLTKTAFTCDLYGTFGSVHKDKSYDDLLNNEELEFYEKEAVRYYSNILASYSQFVIKATDKLLLEGVKIIAPGHGLVYRKNVNQITDDYLRYASYQTGIAKKEIVLLWGSMYGMTEKAVKYIEKQLTDKGINVKSHNVVKDSWGTVLASTWEATGIILAMPTYENKMYPPMAAVLEEILKKKVDNRIAFRLGSYGWAGGAEKELKAIMERNNANWQFLESVEFKGAPLNSHFEAIDKRLDELVTLIEKKLS